MRRLPWGRTSTRVFGVLAALAVVMAIASTVQAAPVAVNSGSVDWGMKQSFRDYVTGIANGTITATGATTNANGSYRFPIGAGGSFDSSTPTATANATGALRFVGHDGALDMTISNPKVQFTGTTGTLKFDVASKNDAGQIITHTQVSFVSLDFTGITPVTAGTNVTWTGVPTALTADGSAEFGGTYPEGQVFDPLMFTLTVGGVGGSTATPTATATAGGSTPTATATATATAGGSTPTATIAVATPTNRLVWRLSQNVWTSSSLTQSRAAGAPAVIDGDNGVVFPLDGVAQYNPTNGATTANFLGSLTVGNSTFGSFLIRIANPSIVVDNERNGKLFADVSYCLTTCSTTPVFVGPVRVVVVNFATTAAGTTDAGGRLSWAFTPAYPLQGDPAHPTFGQFPTSLLNALDPGLQAFFKDTANAAGVPSASNPNKPPAPLILNVAYTTPPVLGGHNLSLQSGTPLLNWAAGTGQTGYLVERIAVLSGGVQFLPLGLQLPANSTTFTDNGTLTEAVYCYVLLPLGGPTGSLGNSDGLCQFRGVANGPQVTGYQIRLNESRTANLIWTNPAGLVSLRMLTIPVDGSPVRFTSLGTTTTFSDPMGTVPTCYALEVTTNTGVGLTDALCGFPGGSSFGAAGHVAGASDFSNAFRGVGTNRAVAPR